MKKHYTVTSNSQATVWANSAKEAEELVISQLNEFGKSISLDNPIKLVICTNINVSDSIVPSRSDDNGDVEQLTTDSSIQKLLNFINRIDEHCTTEQRAVAATLENIFTISENQMNSLKRVKKLKHMQRLI